MRAALAAWARLPGAVRIGAPVAWAAFIWTLSSQPGKHEPGTFWWSFASNGAHAVLFGILAGLTSLAWTRERSEPRPSLAFSLATLYGIADEVHQYFVPDRSASALDVVTDACGALFAVAVIRAVWTRQARPLLLALAGAVGALLASLAGTVA